jgi:hypothetical protein
MKLEKEIIDNIYNKKKEMRNLINKKNRRFLNETYEEKSREMMEKLNFRPGKSFDYVEEERIYEIEVHEGETCEQCGKELNEGETCECGMKEETIYEVEVDEEMEEGNLFGKAVRDAKKRGDDEFTVGGKKYPVKESNYYSFDFKNKSYLLNENEFAKFVNRLVENKNSKTKILYRVKTDLGTHLFTEEKMMDIIEDIVLKEEKNFSKGKIPKGYSEYEKSVKKSKKENDDYITSVSKKMKDYLKDGSKGDYETEPKKFPKGNGQLEKMKSKKYTMSDDGQEFLDDYMHPGMEDLVPDEIQYDNDWIKDNIEGSSRTGNNPEWGNAEETELGKKINKKRKEAKYHNAKMAAYKKSKQPVTDGTGEMAGKGVDIKLENYKKEKLIEEFSRMKNLISYERITQ